MQTSVEFDSYVARLERVSRDAPRLYRARVLLFGMLGYAYVFGTLAALIGAVIVVGALVAKHGGLVILGKLAIPVVILAWTILRAMWVGFSAPEGKEITRADAPELFAEVDAIRRAVKAPRAHHVLLTDEFNAAVSQVPRLGMFGWHRNYLVLGVPLMHALPADEFRAVLAHEFGHLSRAHGRTGAWIYRVRASWARILERLKEAEHRITFIYERFFAWYAPRFAAYSFVLARSQEFEADARAAELVGRGVMASALTRVRVRSAHMENTFWPAVWRRSAEQPEPPRDVYASLVQSFREPIPAGEADILVAAALSAPTRSDDTHPALAERVGALGIAPTPALLAAAQDAPSAADVYLGRAGAEMIERMSRLWSASVKQHWGEQHQEARASAERLAALESAEAPLSLEEARERAWTVASLRGGEAAIPLFRELHEAAPDDAQIRFMLGQLLLDAGDAEGLAHVEAAMDADLGLVSTGCQVSYVFLRRAGRHDEAEAVWRRFQEHDDRMTAARAERGTSVAPTDVFLPHAVSDDAVRAIEEVLRRHADVETGYLVRKEMKLLPEYPLYVLAVVPDWTWKRGLAGDHSARLAQRLLQEVPFPGETLIVMLEGKKKLRKRIAAVPGADIYVRGRRRA